MISSSLANATNQRTWQTNLKEIKGIKHVKAHLSLEVYLNWYSWLSEEISLLMITKTCLWTAALLVMTLRPRCRSRAIVERYWEGKCKKMAPKCDIWVKKMIFQRLAHFARPTSGTKQFYVQMPVLTFIFLLSRHTFASFFLNLAWGLFLHLLKSQSRFLGLSGLAVNCCHSGHLTVDKG